MEQLFLYELFKFFCCHLFQNDLTNYILSLLYEWQSFIDS